MKTLKLKDQAELDSGTYFFHNEKGQKTGECIFDDYYSAWATDDDDNEYYVVWEITDWEAFENGDEGWACDWDKPAEILDDETGIPLPLNDVKLIH